MSLDLNAVVGTNAGSFCRHRPPPCHCRFESPSVILTVTITYLTVFQHPIRSEKANFLRVHGLLAALTTLVDGKPPFGRRRLRARKARGEGCAPERPAGGSVGQRKAASGLRRQARRLEGRRGGVWIPTPADKGLLLLHVGLTRASRRRGLR